MEKHQVADYIRERIQKISTHREQLSSGCAACHVIFSLKDKMNMPEQDCVDLLTEVLTEDPKLNEKFIGMVEQIHMTERNIGGTFAVRERQSKDAYMETYFANVLEELSSDLTHHSHQILLRKLLLAYMSLYIAQTIGVDYHAATEELYYLLRKDENKNSQIDNMISKIETKITKHF